MEAALAVTEGKWEAGTCAGLAGQKKDLWGSGQDRPVVARTAMVRGSAVSWALASGQWPVWPVQYSVASVASLAKNSRHTGQGVGAEHNHG